MPSLSCVHKHLLSSDWKRRPCLSKYLDTVSVCFRVPILQWSLEFLVRVFTFFSLILWYSFFGTFLSMWSIYVFGLVYPIFSTCHSEIEIRKWNLLFRVSLIVSPYVLILMHSLCYYAVSYVPTLYLIIYFEFQYTPTIQIW